MTRIDFYVLADGDTDAVELTACRLTEKAYGLGHRVYLQCENQERAHSMDRLLWSFRDNSFVPHQLCGQSDDETVPVLLGFTEEAQTTYEVLVNLTSGVPTHFERFKRVVEIVAADPIARRESRQRYRLYASEGHEIQTHHL